MNVTQELIQMHLSTVSPISDDTAKSLLAMTRRISLSKNELLEEENSIVKYEYYIIKGIVRTFVIDIEGEQVTTNFHTTGTAITPTLLRSLNRISYINLEVVSDKADILCFEISGMEKEMQNVQDLATFGHNLVMQDSLVRAERELMLAKCKGIEKLKWFRERFKGLENKVSHQQIASYLGITATSLSRLRAEK